MEGGDAAARHAAERAAAGTEDGAAGGARARAACELAAVRTWAVRSASLETTARSDDEMLGEVGSHGVAQAPMADTDTAGTARV